MVFVLKGSDAQNKSQAYGAWLDAFTRDLEAKRDNPTLTGHAHMQAIADVKAIAIAWLNFQEKSTSRSSNFYTTARSKLPGMGPGTAVVFRMSGQRSFTATDAQNLEAHLKQHVLTKHLNLEVGHNPNSPRCVIRISV